MKNIVTLQMENMDLERWETQGVKEFGEKDEVQVIIDYTTHIGIIGKNSSKVSIQQYRTTESCKKICFSNTVQSYICYISYRGLNVILQNENFLKMYKEIIVQNKDIGIKRYNILMIEEQEQQRKEYIIKISECDKTSLMILMPEDIDNNTVNEKDITKSSMIETILLELDKPLKFNYVHIDIIGGILHYGETYLLLKNDNSIYIESDELNNDLPHQQKYFYPNILYIGTNVIKYCDILKNQLLLYNNIELSTISIENKENGRIAFNNLLKTSINTSNIPKTILFELLMDEINKNEQKWIKTKEEIFDNDRIYCKLEEMINTIEYPPIHIIETNYTIYMKIDKTAKIALNIFESPQDTGKSMNLFGQLDRTCTPGGKKKLQEWQEYPLLIRERIELRQNLIKIFLSDIDGQKQFRQQLKTLPDITRILIKLKQIDERQNIFETNDSNGINELYTQYVFVQIIQKQSTVWYSIIDTSSNNGNDSNNNNISLYLKKQIEELSPYKAMIETTVDQEAIQKRQEYLIKSIFDEEQSTLENEKQTLINTMEKLCETINNELNITSIKLQYSGNLGYHLRMSRKDERYLRTNNKYIGLETRKDGVRFTTKEQRQYSHDCRYILKEYEKKQRLIVYKCLQVSKTFINIWDTILKLFNELDVITSFTDFIYTAKSLYICPKIYNRSDNINKLKFIQARHPCLEVQSGQCCISNDINLKKDDSNIQLMTGPNMGGKSTYIRMIGIQVQMSQIGCYIPCDDSEIVLCENISARIGAGDSQNKGVSTFMREMMETASVIKDSTPYSLIIIDELGRGTSTYDGFGLAWALTEHLSNHKINSFVLFATHFYELTSLAYICNNIVNKHVTAHTENNTQTMLYKVKDGPCDRSYGIHVAELVNFPKSVVSSARAKYQKLEHLNSFASYFGILNGSNEALSVNEILRYFQHEDVDSLSDVAMDRLAFSLSGGL